MTELLYAIQKDIFITSAYILTSEKVMLMRPAEVAMVAAFGCTERFEKIVQHLK